MKKSSAAISVGALLLAIQLIPYGRRHWNPPVRQEPVWNQADTRVRIERVCFDCHSNQTKWPWYSNLAPVSWIIQRDVNEGRAKLNFSEWNRPEKDVDEAAKVVRNRPMPPRAYIALHSEARMSESDRGQLSDDLQATVALLHDQISSEKRHESYERREK